MIPVIPVPQLNGRYWYYGTLGLSFYSFGNFPYYLAWAQKKSKEKWVDAEYEFFMLGKHLELENNRRRNESGRWMCWYRWHASTGEGNFGQINVSSSPPAKSLKKFRFYLIIHNSFNNSFSSHLVGVPACCQAAENTLQCTQLGQMWTLFFTRYWLCGNF